MPSASAKTVEKQTESNIDSQKKHNRAELKMKGDGDEDGFDSIIESINYHYEKHAKEVGATDAAQ
ncbi:hypothetical protein [Brevibacillus thermoruber]|uniref:hypothetical protein n=1 Tax=Brevibacillus thermoruber TaxID=33942 RepID=UPI000AE72C07|nr:hypothetical protein [Brevibacillus thermoruber]